MSKDLIDEWPKSIAKPMLPNGYEWWHIGQSLGIKNEAGQHPWWVRIVWTIKGGKKRVLRLPKEHFPTPEQATAYAADQAKKHASRRLGL